MKRLLLIVLPLLLIVGCSSPEPINYKKELVNKNGVWYNNHNEPYSGEVFSLYKVGVMKDEGYLKNGKEDGEWTFFEDDSPYHMTGKGFFKDGNQVGKWTGWYENGQKRKETTYKDGNLISKKEWNEDGSVKE